MDDFESSKNSVPTNTAIAGFIGFAIVGLVLGIVGKSVLGAPTIVQAPPEVIKKELSEEELLALCEETNEDVRDALNSAHHKVLSLEEEIETKEKEIAELKKVDEKDEVKRAAASKRWREMEQEIADLRIQLAEVEAERDDLRTELQETLTKLDKEIRLKDKAVKMAKKYKKESIDNLWTAFTSNAKVQICDKGTRKRHANCHEVVDASLAPATDRFKTCVTKFDTIPVLKKGEKKSELPAMAEWLDPDSKYMKQGVFNKKSWYIIYCDPSLPEARVDADEIPL